MKARSRQSRFFNKGIRPNITLLEKVTFSREELDEYISAVGRDLFTQGLRETLLQFAEADNFGSLIVPKVANVSDLLVMLAAKDMAGNLFLSDTHQRVLKVLRMAEALSPRYAVVVANPPYMGGKGMNPRLSTWAKETYPNSKSDLFAMFIERGLTLRRNTAIALWSPCKAGCSCRRTRHCVNASSVRRPLRAWRTWPIWSWASLLELLPPCSRREVARKVVVPTAT